MCSRLEALVHSQQQLHRRRPLPHQPPTLLRPLCTRCKRRLKPQGDRKMGTERLCWCKLTRRWQRRPSLLLCAPVERGSEGREAQDRSVAGATREEPLSSFGAVSRGGCGVSYVAVSGEGFAIY